MVWFASEGVSVYSFTSFLMFLGICFYPRKELENIYFEIIVTLSVIAWICVVVYFNIIDPHIQYLLPIFYIGDLVVFSIGLLEVIYFHMKRKREILVV
jgi:hypothetical protein